MTAKKSTAKKGSEKETKGAKKAKPSKAKKPAPEAKSGQTLQSLFLRDVGDAKLPKRDTKGFQREKERFAAILAEEDERRRKLVEAQRPAREAYAKAAGLDLEKIKDMHEKAVAIDASLDTVRAADSGQFLPASATGGTRQESASAKSGSPQCRPITIWVCPDRKVCVDQRMPVAVHSIALETGSDMADFTRIGSDGFSGSDWVRGFCYWDWGHQRRHGLHGGGVAITAATTLNAPATVNGFGMTLRELSNQGSAYNAIGGTEFWYPFDPETGEVHLYWKLDAIAVTPGGNVDNYYAGPSVWYLSTGPVGNRVSPSPHLASAVFPNKSLDLEVSERREFPADTTLIFTLRLAYLLIGYGGLGAASVTYGVRASPFLSIHSCTYEYPEYVTVRVSDYLP